MAASSPAKAFASLASTFIIAYGSSTLLISSFLLFSLPRSHTRCWRYTIGVMRARSAVLVFVEHRLHLEIFMTPLRSDQIRLRSPDRRRFDARAVMPEGSLAPHVYLV